MENDTITLRNKNTGKMVTLRRKTPSSQSTQQENPNIVGSKAALGAITKPLVPESNPFLQALSRNPALPVGYFPTSAFTGNKAPNINLTVPGFMSVPNVNAQMFSGETSPLALAGTALGTTFTKGGPTAEDINAGIEQFKAQPNIAKPVSWWQDKPQIQLAKDTRNTLAQVKHGATESYGIDYEKYVKGSDKTINTKNIMDNFVKDVEDSYGAVYQDPDFMEAIAKKDPQATRIRDLIDKFNNEEISVPEEMSVQEADRLQKFIKQLPGIKNKLNTISKGGYADFTNSERMLLDLSNDIKGEVINIHPELKATNQQYGQTLNDIKKIRGLLKEGGTIKNLRNYSNIDAELRGAFERTLPASNISKIKDFENTMNRIDLLKKLGLIAGGSIAAGTAGEAGYALTKHLMGM